MRPSDINYKRLDFLEEVLELLYEKLGMFQEELILEANAKSRFELAKRIEKEIFRDIQKYEAEYGQILAEGVQQDFVVSDEEAEQALVQVKQAVEHIENIQTENYPEELIRLLHEFHEKLDDPGKTAQAKLKIALPIIPLLASYEMEMDTEAFLVNVWRGIKSMLRIKV